MIKQKIYNHDELEALSDNALFHLLKKHWGYKENDELIVLGVVERRGAEDSPIYVLNDLKNKHFEPIAYPLDVQHQTIFLASNLPDGINIGDLVSAATKLSSKNQRTKHGNPLAIHAIQNDIAVVEPGFKKFIEQGKHNEVIETWVFDSLSEGLRRKLNEHTEQLQAEELAVQEQQQLLNELKAEEASTLQQVEQLNHSISNLQQHIKEVENEQGEILQKLNDFIKEKAQILRELEILDEASLTQLIGTDELPEQAANSYVRSDFEGMDELIAHIQAYLYNKGIMYRRSVLENYYTLLSTRDLIVLAGDSGSGKTNLVKSFAEAIGGKSYIIPVKPNWTSAEDLLGYYNPIEQSYLITPFLNALLDAKNNPQVPHFICLDEMNLARVEYYFADFLSLLEERNEQPVIPLYSQAESSHLVSEAKNFLALINEAKKDHEKTNICSFIEILKDEKLNNKLHDLCGFKDGDSLLKYHTRLRKSFDSYVNNPSELKLPSNVFFIGAINVDETTNYLSPKILDRAHIIRFTNPLLQNWDEIEDEVTNYSSNTDKDVEQAVFLNANDFLERTAYPRFDQEDELIGKLVKVAKEYLIPLGIEFGLRTIRQSASYAEIYQKHFSVDSEVIFNNLVRQKILPKLLFDGTTKVNQERTKSNILEALNAYLQNELADADINEQDNAQLELAATIAAAEANDWIVNYWTR